MKLESLNSFTGSYSKSQNLPLKPESKNDRETENCLNGVCETIWKPEAKPNTGSDLQDFSPEQSDLA